MFLVLIRIAVTAAFTAAASAAIVSAHAQTFPGKAVRIVFSFASS